MNDVVRIMPEDLRRNDDFGDGALDKKSLEQKFTWSYSHRAVSGRETRILSILPPVFRPNVVPRS